MARYLLSRLASSVLMLVLISFLIFFVLRMLPGDPTVNRLGRGDGVSEEALSSLREQLGLDQPRLVQYLDWLRGVLTGDFGRSYFSNYEVTTLLGQRAFPTLELAAAALLFAIVISVALAVLPEWISSPTLSRFVRWYVTLGISAPPFVIGIVLIVVLSRLLGWLPASGYVAPEVSLTENLRHLVLPALTLGIAVSAPLVRYLRSSIAEVSTASYVRTARGKGIGWRRTVFHHIFPNALPPAITALAVSVGSMLGGAAVVEIVFAWPGLGQQVVDAVFKRDYPVIQAIVLLAAAAFVVTALATDLLYGALDPRLRRSVRTKSRRKAAA